MDHLSKKQRSWNMSHIRGKNTSPEIMVRKYLHKCGYRFRLHAKSIPGKPDIVLKKYNLLIFVHGCFWHRHQECKFATTPKTNTLFWEQKFRTTVLRDRKVLNGLNRGEWKVLVIWECEVKDTSILSERLSEVLNIKEKNDFKRS
ncbi:MAG: DNA mismatch endonuclease Vsr [Bacteroidetes bacterium]|jgi:DNA mismatch endonuclease, patch repair protein|nr:DNA mismatch endonuclease Vsr [Bacteroidota bacterium]